LTLGEREANKILKITTRHPYNPTLKQNVLLRVFVCGKEPDLVNNRRHR